MSQISWSLHATYPDLPAQFFTVNKPYKPNYPQIVLVNQSLATHLGIPMEHLPYEQQAALFSGKILPKGAKPISQAYAGHQYGHYRILGDGRAHLLGEHITPDGKRVDIQLKGSGATPYSRGGDGKAALRPMLREYIISEAMHHLGIPTTRSLAVISTGESIMRDALLPGAILTRIAASHIRVGTFQFAAYEGSDDMLSALIEYTIQRHYPHCIAQHNKALGLLEAVIKSQIDLIVHWMRVGFIHGVMNTDNMAISGETIDYGPCAFMDSYHADTVFSSIDHGGRYAYSHQPTIALWNLTRLAEALLPNIDTDRKKAAQLANGLLTQFVARYEAAWLAMMRAKLGLLDVQADDIGLIQDLLAIMQRQKADYTNTFYKLSYDQPLCDTCYDAPAFQAWHTRWQARLGGKVTTASYALMRATNPVMIPRNHIVEQALIAAEQGDMDPCRALLQAQQAPYIDRNAIRSYQQPPKPTEVIQQTFCGT